MKKIAFFVEGHTEKIFLEYFLTEYLAPTNYTIDTYLLVGDNFKTISKGIDYENPSYYFYIYTVGNDERVSSAILERADNLMIKEGYDAIIGIRDLFPNNRTLLNQIQNSFESLFSDKEFSHQIFLFVSIMEVEAWFLADYNLFLEPPVEITIELINETLNIDIVSDNIETYRNPTTVLDRIMRLGGGSYSKHQTEVHSICSRLDYCFLCFDVTFYSRIQAFNNFFNVFNTILEDTA